METIQLRKERIKWIDCTKGVAILLVILGHTLTGGKLGLPLRGVIYSIHMPLFFIISAATYHASKSGSQYLHNMRSAAKHLLIPALGLFLFELIYNTLWQSPASALQGDYWINQLLRLLWASGTTFTLAGRSIVRVGLWWFLVALFVGRSIFDVIQWKLSGWKVPLICAVISVIGVLIGQFQRLPFSLDIALAIQPFFYIGFNLKKVDFSKHVARNLLLFGAVWLFTLWLTFPNFYTMTYLELAARRYPLYPICFICSLAGTLLVCQICFFATTKFKTLTRPLCFIGMQSLVLMVIHSADELLRNLWNVEASQFVSAALRIGIDLLLLALWMLSVSFFKKFRAYIKKKNTV